MINAESFGYLAKMDSHDLDEFMDVILCRSCDSSVGEVCEKHDE
jgi:hypothetical protein